MNLTEFPGSARQNRDVDLQHPLARYVGALSDGRDVADIILHMPDFVRGQRSELHGAVV